MIRRVDFHNHGTDRTDILDHEVKEFITRASRNLGPGGIVGLTDMAESGRCETKFEQFLGRVNNYFPTRNIGDCAVYLPSKDLTVVRSLESQTDRGHILTIGLNAGSYVPASKDLPLEEALLKANDLKGTPGADHPFGFEGIGPYLQENDSVIRNGLLKFFEINNRLAVWVPFLTPTFPNRKAREFHRRKKTEYPDLAFGAIISTDGHYPDEPGINYSCLDFPDPREMTNSSEMQNAILSSISTNSSYEGRKSFSYVAVARHIHGVMSFHGFGKTVRKIADSFS